MILFPDINENNLKVIDDSLLAELKDLGIEFKSNCLVYENSDQINKNKQNDKEINAKNAKDNAISNLVGLIAYATTGRGWNTTTTTTTIHANDIILVRYCGQAFKQELIDYCYENNIDFNSYTQGIIFEDSEYVRIPDVTMILENSFVGETSLKYIDFIHCTKALYVDENTFDNMSKLTFFFGSVDSFERNPNKTENAKIWQAGYWAKDYIDASARLIEKYNLKKNWDKSDEVFYPHLYWNRHTILGILIFCLLPILITGIITILPIFIVKEYQFLIWLTFFYPAIVLIECFVSQRFNFGIVVLDYILWFIVSSLYCLVFNVYSLFTE
jgi:hypothetical protein